MNWFTKEAQSAKQQIENLVGKENLKKVQELSNRNSKNYAYVAYLLSINTSENLIRNIVKENTKKAHNWFLSIKFATKATIIPKGTVLYHGTVESFDTRKLNHSDYDNVFWTTKSIGIAKMYIPEYSGYSLSSVNDIIEGDVLLESLGVTDSMKKHVYNKNKETYLRNNSYRDRLKRYKDIFEKQEKEFPESIYEDSTIIDGLTTDEFFKRWNSVEEQSIEFKKKEKTHDLNSFVIGKLKNLGYDVSNYGRFKLLTNRDQTKILPNKRVSGKVFELRCNRDFKLHDIANGKEGDIMDLDYHKLDVFDAARENGYDGIIINDFVKSTVQGSVGHVSYGFFKEAIPELTITKIFKDQKHPVT